MATGLNNLVLSLVPPSRRDERLRKELTEDAWHILNSHIGTSRQVDTGHVSANIRSKLTAQDSLRFSNLLARLLDQDLLTRKAAVLQFLSTLSSSPQAPPIIPPLVPSISRSSPSSPLPRSRRTSLVPPSHTPVVTVGAPSSNVKSKAQILREYRGRHGRAGIPEHLLLRDALYLLQGISGKWVKFQEDKTGEMKVVFIDDQRYILPNPTRALILRLSELGHLYVRVSTWVRAHDGRQGVGMIEQSLCHHLQTQLTEYYRLIAVLESQMSQTPANETDTPVSGIREEETGLTLRRLEVWVDEWRLRMRMMSVCVEGCADTTGGALVSLIYGYTDNGDPFVRKFTDTLLEEVSKPFFGTLSKWLFSGELHDPYSEFFVAANPELAHLQYTQTYSNLNSGALNDGALVGDVGFVGGGDEERVEENGRQDGLKLWQGKYEFREEMLPSFVGETFAKKIFSTGKSLNFIRYSCGDSDWVATRSKLANTGRELKYSDIPGLVRSIDTAYQIASQRLFDIFLTKFRLLDHLRALKSYLLLSQGDFADQLMDSLHASLSRPANTLYRHNLTATLEAAVRSSNARFDPPDVLRRLDARMLEYSHGEIGWDVFTLEYRVDSPVDTVVDPENMERYLKIFHHLWKMKRVEGALNGIWNRVASGAKTLWGLKGSRGGTRSAVLEELEGEWHQIRIVLAEMIHFMRQLQAFCQLEVIECSWKVLMEFVERKEGDLDGLISAHNAYLERVVKKILLMSPKVGKEEHLLLVVREVFNCILQFRDAAESLYNYCLAEAARVDSERDLDRGVYTLSHSHKSTDNLPRILRRVKEYSSLFSERAQSIVHSLQVHPDLDCRFLSVRLNFSDFYKTRKEVKAAMEATRDATKATA